MTGAPRDFDADLLVIGLGPTGDVLAALAAQNGLSVIAVDREPDIFPAPRAAVFDHEIMRIFQMAGASAAIEPECRAPDRYQFVTADDEVLLDFEIAPMTASGWAENYALHQPAVERALRDRLGVVGVDVRLNTGFVDLVQSDEGVTARLSGPQGEYEVRARYLVGCDGGSSPVRELLGVALFDYQFDEPWLVIDAIAEEGKGLPDRVMQICDPRRPITYMKMSGPRYRWEFMIKPGEDPAVIASDESIGELLAPWGGLDGLTIERRAVYRFHGLIAEQWREGRVLLAGDAAHQMPPFAGQGMCAGVRDAANLAWKLAAVVRHGADPALLDTYQIEREPHARAVIETAIAMGKVVCLLDEQAAAGRNIGMLARKAAGEPDIALTFPPLSGGALSDRSGAGALFPQPVTDRGRLDDRLGAGPWLVARHQAGDAPGLVGVWLDDPALADVADDLHAWLDSHQADAALVRPDRHVFGAGDAQQLIAEWNAALKPGGARSHAVLERIAD